MDKKTLRLSVAASISASMLTMFSAAANAEQYFVEDCSSGVCVEVLVPPPQLEEKVDYEHQHDCKENHHDLDESQVNCHIPNCDCGNH